MSTVAARTLAALQAEVRRLTARAAALEQQLPRRPSDAELLAAIAKATEGRAFSAHELYRHARLVDRDLWALLETVDADTPRKIGKLLRRLSQISVGPYRLERMTRDSMGIVWEVRVYVSPEHLHEDPSISHVRSV